MSVVIETTIGDITVDLFTEERPVACLNFMKLCKLKYYNYNLFHTIEQGFIAQTGDPTGSGDGGSSIWGVVEGSHKRFFEGETLPKIHHSSAGLLSLVGAGKHLLASQFFFTLGYDLVSLDAQHCVIGEVVEGHETLRKLNEAIVDEKFRPYQDIRITHTVILDDPFADPRGFRVPSRSPSPSAERLANGRIAADEDIDDTDGKTMEEIQEMLAEREAKARATILEIVGDLPDAEMAPPENVLFVCKLNPVTTDDDLEIIFSRFGRVKCCEVIRDRKTGDSLQYAFVEFEDQKACEAAYFKMDNVLIDDRRIHVDFSQSVSRIKWKGKGRGVEGDSKSLDFNNLRDKRVGSNNDRKWNKTAEIQRSPKRDHRGPAKSRSRSRSRMTSAERRKAREERHREQERRKRSRSKSKSQYKSPQRRDSRVEREQYRARSPERRRNESYRNDRYEDKKYRDEYHGSQKDRITRRSPVRNMDSRSKGRSPIRKEERREKCRSPEKRRNRSSPDRLVRRDHSSPENRRNRSSPDRLVRRDYSSPERNGSRIDKKRKKSDNKKKSKKSRRDSSSSSTSSSSEDSSCSDSDTSSSTESDSSSEEERKKKKKSKSKKDKSKKHKSKKSKSRKHKR